MTGYKSKRAAAQGKLVVTDIDGHVVRDARKPKKVAREPDAYNYARRLAEYIWAAHYRVTAPQWKPLDDLMGVLTQIDNMTSGLVIPPQRQPLTDEQIEDIAAQTMFPINFARAIEAAHGIKENT